jgi:hypothetical protein
MGLARQPCVWLRCQAAEQDSGDESDGYGKAGLSWEAVMAAVRGSDVAGATPGADADTEAGPSSAAAAEPSGASSLQGPRAMEVVDILDYVIASAGFGFARGLQRRWQQDGDVAFTNIGCHALYGVPSGHGRFHCAGRVAAKSRQQPDGRRRGKRKREAATSGGGRTKGPGGGAARGSAAVQRRRGVSHSAGGKAVPGRRKAGPA